MIEIKLCLTEAKNGLGPAEKGLAVELAVNDDAPTPVESKEATTILIMLKHYMRWVSDNRCSRSTHLDGNVSPETLDSFMNAMGVESIQQRADKISPGNAGELHPDNPGPR
jgi:hypothetical protein